MKKKLILLSLLTVFMTGCTVNYTIEIKKNDITETLDISEKNVENATKKVEGDVCFQDIVISYNEGKELLTSYDMYMSESKCASCKTYTKEAIIGTEEVALVFTTNHTFEEYKDSTIPNEYVPGFNISYDDNKLTIYGGNNWNIINDYDYLDEIVIRIKTNFKVLQSNAEIEDNGVYYWSIEKNKENDEIYMIIDLSNEEEKTESKIDSKVLTTILLVILIVILFGLLILFSLFQKKRKINRL